MQFLSVFPDITNTVYFQRKNAGISRTHVVCHVIYIFLGLIYKFFGSSLG